jgi:hypothetical protein
MQSAGSRLQPVTRCEARSRVVTGRRRRKRCASEFHRMEQAPPSIFPHFFLGKKARVVRFRVRHQFLVKTETEEAASYFSYFSSIHENVDKITR